ncbi:MAG: invasion associated locus B family protein [Micavibrio sp.]
MTKKTLVSAFAVFSFIFAAGILALPARAAAAEQQEIGRFGQWIAYVFEENGGKVCYMASKPQKAEGRYSRRGDIVAMITHRPSEGTKDVFSYMAGYGYRKGSDVNLSVDGKKFTLFTQNDMAWAADAAADSALATAIRQGNRMVVKGVSSRGTETTDTYSLAGSTKAYEAISEACK